MGSPRVPAVKDVIPFWLLLLCPSISFWHFFLLYSFLLQASGCPAAQKLSETLVSNATWRGVRMFTANLVQDFFFTKGFWVSSSTKAFRDTCVKCNMERSEDVHSKFGSRFLFHKRLLGVQQHKSFQRHLCQMQHGEE
ncbi:uncharacterized protein LOC123517688 [Portunus trituberculatus]|uniref:uncharacterized protein LOC123517688 n=1 Tax=Portunus trituberculatus TaxID=210409 RepID=UPI001E1CFA97|nr:uncharacterized protein LOC123517688 [Portunus trituberculatus]